MRKHTLIAVIVAVLLSVLAVGFVARRSGRALQAQQRTDIRSENLRTQALKSGSATATALPTNLRKYETVETLAHESNAIVIGAIDSQTSRLLMPAEKLVVTDFHITVRESVKGDLAAGQAITVRTAGGRVDLGEGRYAEVKMPDFWKSPEVGKQYVLFLEGRKDGSFVLRGGPQGLFEITPAETIKAQVRPEDTLTRNYNGKSLSVFLSEVRKAVK